MPVPGAAILFGGGVVGGRAGHGGGGYATAVGGRCRGVGLKWALKTTSCFVDAAYRNC